MFLSAVRGQLLCASLLALCACGGGGSSGGSSSAPNPPVVAPQILAVVDALPAKQAQNVDPNTNEISVAHYGDADFDLNYSGACNGLTAIRRNLEGLGNAPFTQLIDHKLHCVGLQTNTSVSNTIDAQASDGSRFQVSIDFSTGVGSGCCINVLDSTNTPRAAVGSAFSDYITGELLQVLDLPQGIDVLALAGIVNLFPDWTHLTQLEPLYGVTTLRVSYPSHDPFGNALDTLTGLIALPELGAGFTPRDEIVVLMHATGSTPGDLQLTNAWYLLANMLAARGYLVIAADNWGRGGTSEQVETYLLANRTAANSLDFVRQVLADESYDELRKLQDPTELTIIGYSQGGHSAVALWHAIVTQQPDNLSVDRVFAGGAPYNLYRTFQGVVEHLNNTCADDAYCRYVNQDTSVPFATNRILPGVLAYTDTGLSLDSVVVGQTLSSEFVSNFVADDPAVDSLKTILQLSSFTNIVNAAQAYQHSTAGLTLYHSSYDRLVPEANTQELVDLLTPVQMVDYRAGVCSGEDYANLFALTDFVGLIHSLCGIAMMNDVIGVLR